MGPHLTSLPQEPPLYLSAFELSLEFAFVNLSLCPLPLPTWNWGRASPNYLQLAWSSQLPDPGSGSLSSTHLSDGMTSLPEC